MNFTYLLINILSISIPLLLSFNFTGKFYKEWKPFFLSTLLMGVFFIGWDIPFENLGIWGFNDDYLLGLRLFGLPLEEYLFFFCIPYAYMFTYHQLKIRIKRKFNEKASYIAFKVLLVLLIPIFIMNIGNTYTAVVTAFNIVFISLILKDKLKFPAIYWLTYLLICIPFIIVNGALTGAFFAEPVVWYNNSENMGIRLLTIPIEDFLYYKLMLMMNVYFFERFRN